MKICNLLPLLLAGACLPALAQVEGLPPDPNGNVTEEFTEADQDGNGILSIEEASAAFPDLNFSDLNDDTWLNPAEVHQALEDLQLSSEEASEYSVVGEYLYWEIRRAVTGEEITG